MSDEFYSDFMFSKNKAADKPTGKSTDKKQDDDAPVVLPDEDIVDGDDDVIEPVMETDDDDAIEPIRETEDGEIIIDTTAQGDWMHSLPGYQDELRITREALEKHKREEAQKKSKKSTGQ